MKNVMLGLVGGVFGGGGFWFFLYYFFLCKYYFLFFLFFSYEYICIYQKEVYCYVDVVVEGI